MITTATEWTYPKILEYLHVILVLVIAVTSHVTSLAMGDSVVVSPSVPNTGAFPWDWQSNNP